MAAGRALGLIHTIGRVVQWVVLALMAVAVVYSATMVAWNWNAISV